LLRSVCLGTRADLARLLGEEWQERWWCGKDFIPLPSRYRPAVSGWVARVVGVSPAMAVLACFPPAGGADTMSCRMLFEGGGL